jgi:tetratricopeptide (TPR) repeat protein
VSFNLGKNVDNPFAQLEQMIMAMMTRTTVVHDDVLITFSQPGAPHDSSKSRASVPKVQGSEINLTAGEIKKILNSRIESADPRVHDEALLLVAKFPGDYTIDQICSIYDYLKNGDWPIKGWSYARDPRGVNYFNYANESLWIGNKNGCTGAGDCDDFAILISALVESIGGTTRIILAHNNSTGVHAYTEVYLGQLNSQDRQVTDIIYWLKQKYNTDNIFVHIDTNTKDVWLNLDWGPDDKGNEHPGGPFYQGDEDIELNIRETVEKTSPKLHPTEDERILQSSAIPLNITINTIESNSADLWFNKGFALNDLGKYNEAIQAFDKVIEINPSNTYAWNNKGYALINLNKNEEGLLACEKALEIDPNNAVAWNNKVWALNNLRRYEEGLRACEKALEIDPNNAVAWNNKAWALNNLGRYEEGLQACEKALEIDPNNAVAWGNKAIAFFGFGRYEEGLKASGRMIELAELSLNFTTPTKKNEMKPDPENRHFIEAEEGNANTLQVLDHGMTRNVDESKPEEIIKTTLFLTTDNKVYIWLNLGNNVPRTAEYRWYAPSGELYDTILRENIARGHTYLWSWIAIAGKPAANLPGNWHVDVYLNGQKILTEQFSIFLRG